MLSRNKYLQNGCVRLLDYIKIVVDVFHTLSIHNTMVLLDVGCLLVLLDVDCLLVLLDVGCLLVLLDVGCLLVLLDVGLLMLLDVGVWVAVFWCCWIWVVVFWAIQPRGTDQLGPAIHHHGRKETLSQRSIYQLPS